MLTTRPYATGASFGIILILMAIAAIAMLAYVIYYYVFAGLLAPTRRVMAEVVLKRQRERDGGAVGFFAERDEPLTPEMDDHGLAYDFYLVFEVGPKRLEFEVPMSVYVDVEQGDTGLLVHRGTLFREFVKGAGGWSDPVRAPIQRVE